MLRCLGLAACTTISRNSKTPETGIQFGWGRELTAADAQSASAFFSFKQPASTSGPFNCTDKQIAQTALLTQLVVLSAVACLHTLEKG